MYTEREMERLLNLVADITDKLKAVTARVDKMEEECGDEQNVFRMEVIKPQNEKLHRVINFNKP